MRRNKVLAGAAALTLALGSVIVVPAASADTHGPQCDNSYCGLQNTAPGSSDAGGTAQNNENSAERKPTQQIVPTTAVPLEEQTCTTKNGRNIPCVQDEGWWYPEQNCYVISHPDSHKEQRNGQSGTVELCWGAPEEGATGDKAHLGVDTGSGGRTVFVPDADQIRYNRAAKSGFQVAREAIAAHHFDRFTIASLPKDPSDPLYTKAHLWLWVPANTDARTALNTPLVEEKSDGPTHVRMTFKPVGVNINVTGPRSAHLQCKSLGKAAAADQHLQQPSPSCSYQPRVQGRYHLEGEVLWQVSWQAGDQSGEIVHAVPFEGKDIVVVDAAARNVAP